MFRLYPSLLSANLLRLEDEIRLLEPHCDGFHIDVMDNHFVPNLSFGADFVHAICSATKKQVWVHLMVDDPHSWCTTLQLPSNSIVSFHIESTKNISDVIHRITEKKWLPSIAIKPKTSVTEIFPWLDTIHQVLIMSVEPGFSGQPFLPATHTTITAVVTECKKRKSKPRIGIDGGVSMQNIAGLAKEGVLDFAIASAIFHEKDPAFALKRLKDEIIF